MSEAEEPARSRVPTDDLVERLSGSIVWINLRGKLVAVLRAQVDAGDPQAEEQLRYLMQVWPGGAAPRSAEVAQLEQRLAHARLLLEQCLEFMTVPNTAVVPVYADWVKHMHELRVLLAHIGQHGINVDLCIEVVNATLGTYKKEG